MTPLQEYHSRRFVLDGAFAVLKRFSFNQSMQQQVDQLQVEAKRLNWKEYQYCLYGQNTSLYKKQPKPSPF